MDLEFNKHDSWKQFYDGYLALTGEPSTQGWVECNCPIHPYKVDKKSAAVNVFSGHFKCWNSDCQEKYRSQLGYKLDSQILTAREFLIVVQKMSPEDAALAVQDFLNNITPDILDNSKWEKTYRPDREWTIFAEQAHNNLKPDLDIVEEYCKSRGIKYETLVQFKVGYVEDGDYLFFPYYYKNAVVGARARNICGSKTSPKGSYSCLYNITHAINTGSPTVIIVEGETDCLYLTQILQDAGIFIPVISTPGCLFKAEWARDVKQFTKVLCIPQDDDAATGLVKGLKKVLNEKVEIINLPWEPLSQGKDIADFCKQHDKQVLIDLIEQYNNTNFQRRILTGSEFIALADVEIPYIIPGLVERSTKVLISGEPKTYKTWIAFQLVDSVINCTPFLGVEEWTPHIEGMKALIVEEEGSQHRMSARLKKITQGKNLDNFKILHRQSVRIDDEENYKKLAVDLVEFQPDILIFDPYVNIHTQDENSATGTNIVTDAMNRLLVLNPKMAIVIIHHTTKGNTKSPRGSSALPGAVDSMITVTRDSSGVIELGLRGRDLPDSDNNSLSLIFDDDLCKHRPFQFEPVLKEDDMKDTRHRDSIKATLVKRLKKGQSFAITELYKMYSGVCAQGTMRTVIEELEQDNIIIITGEGRRGDPKIVSLREE